MNGQIKILLVDDHALVRESVTRVLESEPDMVVVASVDNASLAVETANRHVPDILLMDIDMPGLISFDAAKWIRRDHPGTEIVFMSAFHHDHYIEQALRAKAAGYVTKSEPMDVLIKAIRQVARGRTYFSPEVEARIVADSGTVRLAPSKQTRTSTLSAREIQVLRYVAGGMSKKQIARTMSVSVKTVEGHVERLMTKLDIHDRVELARLAIREGLVEA